MYTQLFTKSAYSLLESTLTVKEYVQQAYKLGYKKIGLADHNVLHGAIEFYQLCKQKEMQPIIGLLIDYYSPVLNKEVPVYIFAKNYTGYQSLMRLSSKKMTEQQVVIEDFTDSPNDLVFILPEGNEIHLALQKEVPLLKTIFALKSASPLYYQISKNTRYSEEEMEQMKIHNILPIAGELLVNATENDGLALRVMEHIRDSSIIQREELTEHTQKMKKLGAPIEMAKDFAELSIGLETLEIVTNSIALELPLHQSLLPKFPLHSETSASEVLQQLCHKALIDRGFDRDERYTNRVNYELKIINQMGFVDYFLIVWDVMNYAHEAKIVTGAGRGSAAGSLVSYLLKITEVDPIHYNLLFERFLNPERFSMPDIDLDIPDNRREEILLYVRKKYGQDYVSQIATFGTMATKMVLRDVTRVFGLSQSESNRWSNTIPKKLKITLEQSYSESKQLRELVQLNERNQLIFSVAKVLEGLPRHVSTHAAGVIISDKNLWEIVPLMKGSNSIYLSQFTMKDIETIGLLKMDFLGLRNLSIIDDTLKGISYVKNRTFTQQEIPLDDPKTMELFKKGETSGVFQFESSGIRNVLRKLSPDNLEDLAAVNALYRPGPMQMIDTFILRKKGIEPIQYLDDSLEESLKATYGIMVYQEQVMQVASKLAGFTLGESDILRRAISKKDKHELDKQRSKFLLGAIQQGHTQEKANMVYDYIERFADYGFNRSHAFAYSIIGYQMAYLKTHYPVAFFRALLKSVQGNQEKMKEYLSDAKRYAIDISPPDINKSFGGVTIESDTVLRFGLNAIKGVRNEFVQIVLSERKNHGLYQSFDQFLLRMNQVAPKLLKSETLIALIKVGVFDSLLMNRRKLIQELEGKMQNVVFSAGSMDLLDMMPLKEREIEDFTLIEKLSFEEELLGLYLSGHPVQTYEEMHQTFQTTQLIDFEDRKQVQILGYIKHIREIKTKKGEKMSFVLISDPTSEVTAVLFPEAYRKFRKTIVLEQVCFFEGTFEKSKFNQEKQLIVRNVLTMDEVEEALNQRICYIRIEEKDNQIEKLNELAHLLKSSKNTTPVILYYEETKKQRRLQKEMWAEDTEFIRKKLFLLFGEKNVIFK